MKKILPVYCLLLLCSIAVPSVAQKAPVLQKAPILQKLPQAPVSRDLQRVRKDLKARYTQNQNRALQMALKNGWVVAQRNPSGSTLSLQGLDDQGMPVYYVTYDNVKAAATTSTDKVWPGSAAGLNLTGSHPAMAGKFGIWDGGRVRGSHQELNGRVVQRDGAVANDNHATHVAGTLMASGVDGRAKGMAYGATDLQAWDFNFDIPEIAEAASQLLVSNHSYGSTTGWRYNSSRSPRWEWWGDIAASSTEDIKFGQYNFQARDLDQIAFYAPYYLMVKAAGNNRTETGPAEGEPFWRINAARTAWELVESRPAGISSNDSFESIPTYGNTKNMLMVGAVDPIEGGYTKPSDVQISGFSSWGPTDDGRIKPDLVGNGVGVYSSTASSDGAYSYYNGTSMASPNVAGSLFLLQELFTNLNNGSFMRAATLKGVAIHTADEAGPAPGPDYVHGWGLLNTKKAADVLLNTDGRHLLQERTLAQGETYSLQVKAAGNGPLAVTISWTDPEGTISTTLNDRTPRLVNDLDVRVLQGLTTYQPWILNPGAPTSPATFGDNTRDNVEHLYIAQPVAGQTYTIIVRHKGVLQRAPQAFSLVVSGVAAPLYCTSRPSSAADSRLVKVELGSISQTFTGCATYRDLTSLTAQVEPGKQVPFTLTLGTCGANNRKMARIFVDWNNDGDFADEGETVATSGVVAGTADFTGSFPVPTGIANTGDRPRVRIVLMETEDVNQLQACGTYAKGETQEYHLQLMAPTSDVGITALVLPQDGVCASPNQSVTVNLKNFGVESQTNIPLSTEVWDGATLLATLEGTYTGPLEPHREVAFTFPGTVSTSGGKIYSFVSASGLSTDQNIANNTHTASFTTSNPSPRPTDLTAVACGDGPVSLKATSAGTLFWYDALQGGSLIGTGPAVSTTVRPTDSRYYVAANDFSGSVGPKTKNAFNGGGYNQYVTDVYFSTHVPLMLDKVRLYIGNPGRLIITVQDTRGQEIATTSLDVAATRNPAGTGAQTNDLKDTGSLYSLGLEIPEAGNYVLKVAYQHGATLFRNNSGVTGYPFSIPGVISITGNSTSTLFYYFLYDLQVKSLGCPSARVPVSLESDEPAADLTVSGPTTFCQGGEVLLQVPGEAGHLYQWHKDGTPIAGASTSAFRATESGVYHVSVTNPQSPAACSQQTSATATVTVTAAPTVRILAQNALIDLSPLVLSTGESVVLEAALSTEAQVTFQWRKDGQEIAGATNAHYTAMAPGRYTVEARPENCTASVSELFEVKWFTPEVQVASLQTCAPDTIATLSAQADTKEVFWYDAPTAGNLLGIGARFTTPRLTASTSYFAGVNDFSGKLASPTAATGSRHSAATGGTLFFDADIALVLRKVSIRVGTPGTITIALTAPNRGEGQLGKVTLAVSPNQTEYTLNLVVPQAGKQYGLRVISFEGGATALLHESTDAVQFPYALPGIVSITGTNQAGASTAYYYLYDWQVSAFGPASATRREAAVTFLPPTVGGQAQASATTVCGKSNGGTVTLSGQTGAVLRWESSEDLTTWSAIAHTAPSLPFSNLSRTTYFRAVVQNGTCAIQPSGVATVEVTTGAQAVVSARGATTFCQGGFVTLAASAGTSYRWSTGQNTRTINVTASGSYSVTVTNETGCSSTSAPTLVTVNPLPAATITANGPTSFCKGGTVTLTASEGAAYHWSDGQTSRSITVAATGSYAVTVTDALGCGATSGPVQVTVHPVPVAAITANGPTAICEGGSVVLTASEGTAYRWSTGETTRTITARTAGSYTVTVTNTQNCSTVSAALPVTLYALPASSITKSGPVRFCQGGTVTLTAAEGTAYLWSNGETDRTITVSGSGNYSVAITNANGCTIASETVAVAVQPLPGATITPTGPTAFCEGGSVVLTASEGAAYLWSGGQTSRSITVGAGGAYTVTVTSEAGCSTTSEPVTVTMLPAPVAVAGNDAAICLGGTTTLSASGGTHYAWSPALGLSATDVANPSASPLTTTTYTVTVTNEQGCTATDQVTVLVMPAPAALITPRGATTFCQGSHVTLAASEGAKYLWSDGQTTRTINVTASGTYTVTVTNDKGCSSTSAPVTVAVQPQPIASIATNGPTTLCAGESVTLTASEGTSYLWSNGQTTRAITVQASGSYTVTVANSSGCSALSSPVAVAVTPAIANNLVSGAQAVCNGAQPATLSGTLPTGGDHAYGFLWESSTGGPTAGFAPAAGFNKGMHYAPQTIYQATWFRRRVFSGTCSHISDAVLVSVKVPPSASIEESSAVTSICEGTTTTLTAKGGNRFLWSTGALTQSITVNKSGTYTATVINEEDCYAVTQAVSISVKMLPPTPEITQKGNWLVSSFASGNQWYRDGVAIAGATEQAYEAFLSGSYTVVTSHNGCLSAPSAPVQHQAEVDEQTLRLVVFPNPSHGTFSVDFEVQGLENGQLRLVNMLGQEVYTQEVTGLSGKQSLRVEAEHLAHGIYILQLRIKDKVFTRRVQVRR